MTAYCERRLERLPDRPYCARPEYHDGPHQDSTGRTNPPRRRYRIGRPCQDCGRRRPTTVVYWWSSGTPYTVCGDCIRPYRHSILAPCRPGCAHQPAR